jgi:phenylacetate-CoA ligase
MAAIEPAIRRARGTAVVAAAFLRDRRTAYEPLDRLSELRDARLRRLVAYAAETVPYYRELFASHRVEPREIRTAADLESLPIVEKEMVQADPERFRSDSATGREAISFRTSGSTGMPLLVYHDRGSLLANLVWGERERAVEARLCRKRVRYLGVDIESSDSTDARARAFYRATTFTPFRPARHCIPVDEPMEAIVARINKLRPDVIRGYGTHLETLFRMVDSRGVELHTPKVVVYASDLMTAEGRRFIESRFGVPVISSYNAVEAFKIGFTCEERRGFHLHEDLCVVRIVDPHGQSVSSGEQGEVVITNLVNQGTVLLNYRLGDVGVRSTEPCRCGRTLPLLLELQGRVGDFIRRPDGRLVGSTEITEVVTSKEGVLRYQLVQHEADRFELRLQTTSEEACARVQGPIVADLRLLFGGNPRIETVRRGRIEPGPEGRFRRVFSLSDGASC